MRKCACIFPHIEPHRHSFFHYIYSFKGHTSVKSDGAVYETMPGSLVLLPPGIVFEIPVRELHDR